MASVQQIIFGQTNEVMNEWISEWIKPFTPNVFSAIGNEILSGTVYEYDLAKSSDPMSVGNFALQIIFFPLGPISVPHSDFVLSFCFNYF
jgi:hypothetical protein